MKYHRAQKQNRSHQFNPISEKLLCESCQAIEETNSATSFCLDCEEPELFCQSCAKRHLLMKYTKHHHISDNLNEFAFMTIKKTFEKCPVTIKVNPLQQESENQIPGQTL